MDQKIDSFLIQTLAFKTTRSDACLHTKISEKGFMVIATYVDDLLLAGTDLKAVTWMKSELNRFEMKYLGEAKKCIGLEINRKRVSRRICVSQTEYAKNILKSLDTVSLNPVCAPMEQLLHP